MGAVEQAGSSVSQVAKNPVGTIRNDPYRAGRAFYTFGASEVAPKGLSTGLNKLTGGMFEGAGDGSGYQIDPGERPTLGDRSSFLGDPRGMVNPKLMDTSNLHGSTSALNALQTRALSNGPSPWLNMQLDKQKQEQSNALNKATMGQAGNLANAQSNLASHGGLTGGAAERLARGGQRDMNATRQDINNQGMQARTGLEIAEDQNKMSQLNNVAGLGLQHAQLENSANQYNTGVQNAASQFNAGNALAENERNNQYNMQRYGEQMKGYGAANSANAIAAGGGGGGGGGGKK